MGCSRKLDFLIGLPYNLQFSEFFSLGDNKNRLLLLNHCCIESVEAYNGMNGQYIQKRCIMTRFTLIFVLEIGTRKLFNLMNTKTRIFFSKSFHFELKKSKCHILIKNSNTLIKLIFDNNKFLYFLLKIY